MPSFHFKRNCSVYLVTSVHGSLQKYKLAVYPDLSFSQTFAEEALNVKTLHNQDAMFESAVINKANPANFNFTVLLINSADHITVSDMLTSKNTARDGSVEALFTGDLYIDTGIDIFKLTKCVFERGTYQIQKDALVTVTVSGSASKLERWSASGTIIPGTAASTTETIKGIIPRATNVVLDGVALPDIVTITLELANDVQWLDYNTLHKSLAVTSPTDTVYPGAFVVSRKTLSGTIQQYITDTNESRVQSWSTNSSLTIQVGDVGNYYFNVIIPSVVFTNRVDPQDIFVQTYDFRMTSNPTDLSTVIQPITVTVPVTLVSSLEWGIMLDDYPVGTDNNWFKLAEVKFYDENGTQITSGGTISAHSYFTPGGTTYAPSALVDGNAATFWLSGATTKPGYIKNTYITAKKVTRIDIQGPADLTNGSPPSAYRLGYWTSGVFTPLATFTGVTWSPTSTTKTHTIQ